MNKHLFYTAALLTIIVLSSLFVLNPSVQASNVQDGLRQVGGEAYYNDGTMEPAEANPTNIVGSIIEIALGFLGIIFVILIIVSGYQWMTAGGNATTIETAKKRIINSVVGLLIVLTAFTITLEVLNRTGDILTNN
ncbi:hypothetical protein ISR92_01385 [Patescibacteria group bacterium]|nr:hypothetical protein [Patescibacteria group bacterium]